MPKRRMVTPPPEHGLGPQLRDPKECLSAFTVLKEALTKKVELPPMKPDQIEYLESISGQITSVPISEKADTQSAVIEQARQIIIDGCGCDQHCMVSHDGYCGCRDDAKRILTLCTSPAAQSGDNVEGFVLAPVDPDDAMIEAGEEEILSLRFAGATVYAANVYAAMVKAIDTSAGGRS